MWRWLPTLMLLGALEAGCQKQDVVGVVLVCEPGEDRDGDGIADRLEEDRDTDGDGIDDDVDMDADADTIPDAIEARSSDPCAPADTDGDGTPDFRDDDSDGEGLTDADEAPGCTDPTLPDTDRDGITDFVELRATGTDPCDAADTIGPGDLVVVLPFDGASEIRTLTFASRVRTADIYFLADSTVSMANEREALRIAVIGTLRDSLERTISGFHIGFGGIADYPAADYGRHDFPPEDSPYMPILEISPPDADRGTHTIRANIAGCPAAGSNPPGTIGTVTPPPNTRRDLVEALEVMPCGRGGDEADAYTAALWSMATGGTLSWPAGTDGMRSWAGGALPDQSCPTVPGERGPRVGFPCFRPDALPIVVLTGDGHFHEGPGGGFPYDPTSVPETPTYDEAVAAVRSIGARVAPIFSGGAMMDAGARRAAFESVARDTGTVLPDGTLIVRDVADDGTGYEVVIEAAVRDVVDRTPHDVTAEARSGTGPDGFDPTTFVQSIEPVQGVRDGIPGPRPGISYRASDENSFFDVVPGTQLVFRVELANTTRPGGEVVEVFTVEITAIGNGVAVTDVRTLYIVVPPAPGT